jgi:hypothetical protein
MQTFLMLWQRRKLKVIIIFRVISLVRLSGEHFDAMGQTELILPRVFRTNNKLDNTVSLVVVFWHSRFLQHSTMKFCGSLVCNAVRLADISRLRRNILSPFSGFNRKPSVKRTEAGGKLMNFNTAKVPVNWMSTTREEYEELTL